MPTGLGPQITPQDVKLQLMSAIPKFTDEFSEIVSGSAIVDSGVVKITSADHGLSTDDVVVGSAVSVIIPVTGTSFDIDAKETTITVGYEHDRTSGKDNGGYNKAVLEGFDDPTYNGSDFTIKSATRTTMVIAATADAVGVLGNMIEPRSLFVGFLSVTVIDANTFTVSLEDTKLPEGAVFDTFDYVTEQRIYIAADITRAYTAYAQRRNPKPALFVVFTETVASKDRNVINDAVAAATGQNELRITYIPNVTLMSFAPTKTEHSAAIKQQQIYEEVRPALMQAMFGVIFNTSGALINFAAYEESNMPNRFNTGYYVHNFNYQIPYSVSIEQGDTFRKNVSFRDIIVNCKMFNNEGDLVVLEAELEI